MRRFYWWASPSELVRFEPYRLLEVELARYKYVADRFGSINLEYVDDMLDVRLR